MDINSELLDVTQENVTLIEGNVYENIYLDIQEQGSPISQTDQFTNTDGALNVVYEKIPLEYTLKGKSDVILSSNATEDESMAIEALRQLGNSTVYTKLPQDLPLLTCADCNVQFRTTADYQNHSSICKQTHLKCHICNETYNRTIDFNNHLICHTVQRPHSCRICGTLFVLEKDFLIHLNTHEIPSNINQCKVCGKTFNRCSSLTNHMKIHKYQPGRAIMETLKSEVDYLAVSDSVENYTTPICEVSSSNWDDNDLTQTDNFNDVAQEMTIETFENGKNNGEEFAFEFLKGTEITDVLIPKKVDCNGNEKPNICKYCDKRFAREKALISHLMLHSNALENYYNCRNCDEHLTDEESLAQHSVNCKMKFVQVQINQVSNNTFPAATEHSKLKSYKYECSNCNKRFTTRQKMHRHMWIHRKKTFTCETCGTCFEKQLELNSHRLSTHRGSSAYACNNCGKCFSSRQGLWEHNRVHNNNSNSYLYKCDVCSKICSSRQGYLIHMRAHNNERPYGCKFCWKSFRDGGTLKKHERIHTGERPHACPLCNKAFNQKVVLREHVRWLHAAIWQSSEDGIFECSLCDHKLTDRDDLCTHIIKHSDHLVMLGKEASKHNIVLSRVNDEKVIVKNEIEVKSKSKMDNIVEEKNFSCDLCNDKFLTKQELSQHALLLHI